MEKLTNPNLTILEMITIMGEGHPGAQNVIMRMLSTPRGLLDVLLLDSLDIRGYEIYYLFHDSCESNMDKFNRTLMMLRSGVFTRDEIHNNIGEAEEIALPFIDDDIAVEGVPPYGESFGPTSENWKEFCAIQKEAYITKLNRKLERKNGLKPNN